MPRDPGSYAIAAQVYVRGDDPLADFILSNMLPGEKPGHTIKRLLRELMSIKWFNRNSRRIKRNIKKELKRSRR